MNDLTTRVLLVEDEEDAREILGFYLETIFDEVQIACDGQIGFDLYEKYYNENKPFDLVLTDIKMPNKDGLTMLEEITALNDEQKFVIVSAYKDEEYLFKSINLNVLGYFVKPLEVKNIMEILKKIKEKVLKEKEQNSISNDNFKINNTFTYNFDTQFLYKNGKIVDLSKKEMLLVKALIEDIEKIKSKEYLKEYVWNDVNTSDATLRTVIKRVKDKINDDDFIQSKKGLGYLVAQE